MKDIVIGIPKLVVVGRDSDLHSIKLLLSELYGSKVEVIHVGYDEDDYDVIMIYTGRKPSKVTISKLWKDKFTITPKNHEHT